MGCQVSIARWWPYDHLLILAALLTGFNDHDIETVKITAALHDIADTKYQDVEEGRRLLQEALGFLICHGCDKDRAQRIGEMVRRVGFKEELKGGAFNESDLTIYPELGPVQDADKLDAIGRYELSREEMDGHLRDRHKRNRIYLSCILFLVACYDNIQERLV